MSNRENQITDYLDNIESQHRTKTRFIETLRTILAMIDHGTEVAEEMPLDFYVQNAVGTQLDILGEIIGADRRFPPVSVPGYPETLNDDLFRYVLLAKIVQNSWDGTNENFKEIWDATMSGKMEASYYDNQDMSMDVKITGPTEPLMVELLLHGYILPKPLGVRMNINAITEMVEDMSRAEGVATLNDAKIGCPLDYFPERDTENASNAASVIYGSSGYLFCGMEYPKHSETADDARSGAVIAASTGYAVCCMEYRRHSGVDETGYSGIGGIANSARVTITTI